MPRKRRACALLEVINSGKGFNGRPLGRTTNLSPASSPWKINWRWWQRRPTMFSSSSDAPAAYDPSDPTTSATARSMQPATIQSSHDATVETNAQDVEERAPRALPFRMNATAMIVAGFAAVAGIGLVMMSGRHSPPPALIATEDVEKPMPSVLEIEAPVAPSARRPAEAVLSPASRVENTVPAVMITPQKPPTLVIQDTGRRTIGLNYVVIQSYPDEKSAINARDALIKNGIHCTIEKGLTGWPSTWSSVVGMTGFDKVYSSVEYDKYIKKVEAVSKTFAGSSKFRTFKPQPYKWKVTQ